MAAYTPNEAQLKFFDSEKFGVVGASTDKTKFGNKVLMWYIDRSKPVTPVHPKEASIEGITAVKSLSELPNPSEVSISVVTPPKVTLGVVKQAVEAGIHGVWIQPGADDEAVAAYIKENDLEGKVVYGGPCILASGDKVLAALGK